MKINQVLMESAGATVAFAFGRFNPAHQGHIEVWRAVEDAGANWFVGTNPNTIGPNDPLTFEQKSAWMEEIYPPIGGHIVAQTSVLTLAAYIFKKTRKNERATVAYITDATDWAWSGKLLNQYNGVEGAHGYYKFAEITHVPSPRVSSATALRDAARANDKVAFYQASGTDPKSTVDGLTYFDTVKQAVEEYPLPVKRGQKVKEQGVAEHIVKVAGGWELKSKHGDKNLGKYPTKAGAEKRERQVQYFKHVNEEVAENQGDSLKFDALEKLIAIKQQIQQEIQQKQEADIAAWKQDFEKNTVQKAKQQLSTTLQSTPVAQAGEKYNVLKDRLVQLNVAIQKHKELINLIDAVKEKYPAVADRVDSYYDSILPYTKAGAKDNYKSLIAKLNSIDKDLRTSYPGAVSTKQGVAEGKDFDRCFDQACKLYDRAVSKNLEPKLVQVADFQGDGNGADPRWMKLPQHVWQHYVVIVGDQVLDPTAKQFGDTMPTQYQVSDLDRLWGKQYQIRPRQGVAEGYYDSDDYYNARLGGEYGKNLSGTRYSAGGAGTKRDDILKGQSKHLPADPFSRTSGVVPGPESKQGQIHRIALPGEMGETVKVNFRNINNELGQIHSIRNDLAKVWLDDYERFVVVPLDSLTPYDQGVTEDDESSEVKKQGQLIPWPAGTTKVHVSDVYDWYKLGMVISDLDDADPKMFGQGAPQSIIAFGSEEEESKLLPLLKRLGLRVDDIDPEGTDEIGEAYHAGALYEYLNKASIKENASRMISAHDKNGFITVIIQAPDGTKKALTNDNPRYINQWLMRYDLTLPQSITNKFKQFSLTEFAPSDDSHGDEKSYLLQLADDLFQAIYVARNKMAVKAVKDKIIAVGGDVKIVWNKNGSFNVVMFHPVHFKQGHLVSLVGDSDSQRMGESTLKEINRRDLLKGISAVALAGIDASANDRPVRCTKWTYRGVWPNLVVTCVATDQPPEEKKPNPNVNPNIRNNPNTSIKLKKENIGESSTTPGPVEAWGYRYNERDQRVMWRLNFDSEAAARKWADSKNATIMAINPVKQLAEEEQKTVAKTWDQMTPEEKSSGVKGRTLWNEKTQRYYTVFDVPVDDKEVDEDASLATMRNFFAGDKSSHNPDAKDKRFRSPAEYEAWLKQNKLKQISGVREDDEIDEASLKTMRDFFAGDKNARDPFDITTQRLHFSQDPEEDKPTKDIRFRSPAEYEEWLVQNKLKKVSGPTVPPNDKVHQLQGPAKPKN